MVITLLTDYGLQDGYSGVLKGVIWNIAPQVQIADLSHTIHPQDIQEGALALSRTAFFFPAGTIHLAVVDPGVGTQRRPVALRLGDHRFIGPDNGLFTLVYQHAVHESWSVDIVHLDQPQYWLPQVSRVFHGRDIFAPVAAHLAGGVPLESVGTPITDLVLLNLPEPQKIDGGWLGEVIAIDHFGNLSTNLQRTQLEPLGELSVKIAGQIIAGLSPTFGARPSGNLIALYGTHDDLNIAVVNGNAAQQLRVVRGEPVFVTRSQPG